MLSEDSRSIGPVDRTGLAVLAVVAVALALLCVAMVSSRVGKQIREAYPIGVTAYAESDAAGLRVSNALGETFRRWDQIVTGPSSATVLRIEERAGSLSTTFLANLVWRLNSSWVPGDLLGAEDVGRLRIPAPAETVEPSALAFPRSNQVQPARAIVMTAEVQRRLGRDAWLAILVKPVILFTQVMLAVVVVGSVAVGISTGLAGDGWLTTQWLVLVVLFGAEVWVLWWMPRHQARVMFPVGFSTSVRIDDLGIRLVTALDERLIPWALLRDARRRGTALIYPSRTARMEWEMVPADLVPNDVLDQLGCRPSRPGRVRESGYGRPA
ncbi:hypothetical protein [Nocardioides sp. YR527]|uniref:hypothetical protein n=1 Tax=Nocardioides sp. YR527 TaxID=1881028 RepID=UPI00115FD929|nr:hypothetical protein [Nocardioides sp. YR527]